MLVDSLSTDVVPFFKDVCYCEEEVADGIKQEALWMQNVAASGCSVARLWRGSQSLVVPRSYERAPRFLEACIESASLGWPVHVRSSGGGLVPQNHGVLNLSLIWRIHRDKQMNTDSVYRAMCTRLSVAMSRLGILASIQEVAGSFCDGRYSLAVKKNGLTYAKGASVYAKLIGTAQCWRRIEGEQAVLAHAMMLVDANPVELTDRCNVFEASLGYERRYCTGAVTNVVEAWSAAHSGSLPPPNTFALLVHAITEAFTVRSSLP